MGDRELMTSAEPRVDPMPEKTAEERLAPLERYVLNVLIVDDEPRFLASLRLAIEDLHHVEARVVAADALALLEAEPSRFDIILCDLAMPVIDGVAFYERCEKLGLADRFVLMSGGAFTTRGSDFVARDVCRTIVKPFALEKLLALLEEVSRARAEARG